MTLGDWVILAVGVVLWVWLFRQILSRDGFLDKDLFEHHLPACLGCQRYRMIPGCPVHDPQKRKAV